MMLAIGVYEVANRYQKHIHDIATFKADYDSAIYLRKKDEQSQTDFKNAVNAFSEKADAIMLDANTDTSSMISIVNFNNDLSSLMKENQTTELLQANRSSWHISDNFYENYQAKDNQMQSSLSGANQILTAFESNPIGVSLAMSANPNDGTLMGQNIGIGIIDKKDVLSSILEIIDNSIQNDRNDERHKQIDYNICNERSFFLSIIHPECINTNFAPSARPEKEMSGVVQGWGLNGGGFKLCISAAECHLFPLIAYQGPNLYKMIDGINISVKYHLNADGNRVVDAFTVN